VASIAGTDLITREARLREQLADMLVAAGQVDGARIELSRSAELLAEKAYVVAEQRVRAKLAALG